MKKGFFVLFPATLAVCSFSIFALPFSIVVKPSTSLPTSVQLGNTATAYYTVTNITDSVRNNNYIKWLPGAPGAATQVTTGGTYGDTCGATFNLAPSASCTLQLTIANSISSNDPDQRHHLFACFPGGEACAGTDDSLNATAIPVFAYIGSGFGHKLSFCAVQPGGALSNCVGTGVAVDAPVGLGINPAKTKLYFTDQGDNSVTYCSINSASGALSGCAKTGGGFLDPFDITINPAGTFAYVPNFTNPGMSTVTYCTVNSDGSLTACASVGAFDSPAAVAFNSMGTYAFITSYVGGTVTVCTANINGTLTSCSAQASGLSGPIGIVVNPSNTYIYVANSSDDTVSYCPLTGGTLGSCATTGSGFLFPQDLAISADGKTAYVTSYANQIVYACPINTDGTFGTCSSTANGLAYPGGIQLS